MLALLVAWLLGKGVELTEQHTDYQANTVRHRIVLSLNPRAVLTGKEILNVFEPLHKQTAQFHADALGRISWGSLRI